MVCAPNLPVILNSGMVALLIGFKRHQFERKMVLRNVPVIAAWSVYWRYRGSRLCMVRIPRSFRVCIPCNLAAANSSDFVIGLFRPSIIVFIVPTCWQDEGCTYLMSLRPPCGWFCNYTQSDNHHRKNSQCHWSNNMVS